MIGTVGYFYFVNYMESLEVDLALSMVNSASNDEIEKLDSLNNIENGIFISLMVLSCLTVFSFINDYIRFKKK